MKMTLDVIIPIMIDKTVLNNILLSTPLIVGITLYLYIKQHWFMFVQTRTCGIYPRDVQPETRKK